MIPLELNVDRARGVAIRWDDGETTVIPFVTLRRACPCAACRENARQNEASTGLPILGSANNLEAMATLDGIRLVGTYAVRFVWRDGHDTGIYNYELLRGLGGREAR